MALYLKAAYEILRRVNRPLSPDEITGIALEEGLLSSSGQTPAQTMKSKLSTEILRRGEDSPFMRSEKGKFALRDWKDRMREHVADRYQKALFDEDIVVIPAASLDRYVPTIGLYAGSFNPNDLLDECRPMRRREAEADTTVIQLVSVFIVRHGTKYLTYKRTKRLPESRLHGFYSIAFGGHLNPKDLLPLLNIFDPAIGNPLLRRELYEELRLPDPDSAQIVYRGLLYDDSQPVSRQHLGLTYTVYVQSEVFEIGERGFLMDAKYESLDEIARRLHDFENWSVLLYSEETK